MVPRRFGVGVYILLALWPVRDAVKLKGAGQIIKLIEDLNAEIEAQGQQEAEEYAQFAQWCKETDTEEEKEILKDGDEIQSLSAGIGSSTAMQTEKEADLTERQANQNQMADDLTAAVQRCSKARAEYEAASADASQATAHLKKGIDKMKAKMGAMTLSEPSAPVAEAPAVAEAPVNASAEVAEAPVSAAAPAGAEVAEAPEVAESPEALSLISYTLTVADAMNLVPAPKRHAVAAFLQGGAKVDPSDPAFKYHSTEITEILEQLLGDFTNDAAARDKEWNETSTACSEEKDGLSEQMQDNMEKITAYEGEIQGFKKEVNQQRTGLVETQEQLEGDETELKTTTAQCEAKAAEFDKRSKLQAKVLQAMNNVHDFFTKKLAGSEAADEIGEVGEGEALLQKGPNVAKALLTKATSFLQVPPVKMLNKFLAKGSTDTSQKSKAEQVISLLRVESDRLGSPELALTGMKIAADHFKKARSIINDLIGKLNDEANAEISKNAWCKQQIGSAKHKRDKQTRKVQDLNAELKQLESTKEELETEIKELQKAIEETQAALRERTEMRANETEDYENTTSTLKTGISELNEAKAMLDKDAGGPQAKVIALMETIGNDFSNILAEAISGEKAAEADFKEYVRNTNAEIKSKEVKKQMDEEDLRSTASSTATALDGLQTQMGLVDNSLQLIEQLKPACIGGDALSQERLAKREEEISALRKALTVLDHDTSD